MKKNFTDWVLFIITLILALAGIVMVIYKITGHFPTIEEIMLVLIATLGGLLIKHMTATSKFEGKTITDISHVKRELHELKTDVRELRIDASDIKKTLAKIS